MYQNPWMMGVVPPAESGNSEKKKKMNNAKVQRKEKSPARRNKNSPADRTKGESSPAVAVSSVPKTTVVLRNIPKEFTRDEMISLLHASGFLGKFDFIYVPFDFRFYKSV